MINVLNRWIEIGKREPKFIHMNGKAQETLNPEWIAQNYPDTWDNIYKKGLSDARLKKR